MTLRYGWNSFDDEDGPYRLTQKEAVRMLKDINSDNCILDNGFVIARYSNGRTVSAFSDETGSEGTVHLPVSGIRNLYVSDEGYEYVYGDTWHVAEGIDSSTGHRFWFAFDIGDDPVRIGRTRGLDDIRVVA